MKDNSQISDGYHTFAELYEHRHALFLNLVRIFVDQYKYCYICFDHYEGWDLITIPVRGISVGYHIPISYRKYYAWGLIHISKEDQEKMYKEDPYTSQDVVNRLLGNLIIKEK